MPRPISQNRRTAAGRPPVDTQDMRLRRGDRRIRKRCRRETLPHRAQRCVQERLVGCSVEEQGHPLALSSARRRQRSRGSFVIDGEAVVSDKYGVADFEKLHSREHDTSAMLLAFDLLELNGEDLRQLTLDDRKSKLAKLLEGISPSRASS
jgi:hypothetical protein